MGSRPRRNSGWSSKLVITLVLLNEPGPISLVAKAGRRDGFTPETLHTERISLVVHSGGGLVVLLVPMVLSIYKPRGLTRHRRRRQQTTSASATT